MCICQSQCNFVDSSRSRNGRLARAGWEENFPFCWVMPVKHRNSVTFSGCFKSIMASVFVAKGLIPSSKRWSRKSTFSLWNSDLSVFKVNPFSLNQVGSASRQRLCSFVVLPNTKKSYLLWATPCRPSITASIFFVEYLLHWFHSE